MALKGSIKHHLLWYFLQATMNCIEKRKCKTPTKLLFANTEVSIYQFFSYLWPLGAIYSH